MFKRRIPSKLQTWVDGIFLDSILLTFIVRHLNPVFVLTVWSFLRDGPLNAQYICRGLER
jgi:hypothetical protein